MPDLKPEPMTADSLRATLDRIQTRQQTPAYPVLAVEPYGTNWKVYVDVSHWPNSPDVVPGRLAEVGLRSLSNGWDCGGFYLLVEDK
jgi:hypothetical protein